MSSRLARSPGRALLSGIVLWALLAAAFSWVRVPYDDEWASITTARSAANLLVALPTGVHPPWVSAFDWLLATFSASTHLFLAIRILPSAAAVYLLSWVAIRRLDLRRPWLAAFHPVVFMYAASARWYPFLFLAQALRAWALWGTHRRGEARTAFASGGLLGPMAGYVDLAFLAHDSLWYLFFANRRGQRRSAVVTVGCVAAANVALLVLCWALGAKGLPDPWQGDAVALSLPNAIQWLGSGLVGQAMLPGARMALAAVAVPGFIFGARRLLSARRSRPFGLWLSVTLVGWLGLAWVHVIEQPRYDLLVWFLLTCALLALVGGAGFSRLAGLATLGYLLFALGLTLSQRYFIKGDLNLMPAEDCAALSDGGRPELILAPYPQTAEELASICAPGVPIVSASWGDFGSEKELEEIRRRTPGHREILLVTVPIGEGRVAATNAGLRTLLASHCAWRSTRQLAPDPHFALKRRLHPTAPRFRLTAERWDCDWPAGP